MIDFSTDCIVIAYGADCMVGYLICITICVTMFSAFPFTVATSVFATLVVAILVNINVVGCVVVVVNVDAVGYIVVVSYIVVFIACIAVFIACIVIFIACVAIFIACVVVFITGVCVPPPDSKANVKELTKEEATEETGVESSFGQAKKFYKIPSETAHG